MNQERKNAILAYEKIYGKTSPLPESAQLGKSENYLGCKIEGENIIFIFSDRMSNDQMSRIETIFRNRLGRKISFMAGGSDMTIFANSNNKEELAEYLIASQIADNIFRGEHQSIDRIAEMAAYCSGEDWRDEEVVSRHKLAIYKAS